MLVGLVFCLNLIVTAPSTCAVFTQIKKHTPTIETSFAIKLSKSIELAAKKHNVRADILTAIIRQESNFKMGAFNKKSLDYGLTQINSLTIKNFKFNKYKLMTDIDYSINAGAIVLADFKKRYFKREGYNYWCRYNSSKPSKRAKYRSLVSRYL